MEPKIDYIDFLKELDKKLDIYFQAHSAYLCCKKGCSSCCEIGDYPLSELELNYLMQGFIALDNETKILVQNNFRTMQRGKACPFLINKICSVYSHRPIICRVHGLAYFNKNKLAKLPYCVNENRNYSKVYEGNELLISPIEENLDTQELLKNFNVGEVRNLYDWINITNS